MRTIGFSTGAIALGDFRGALHTLAGLNVNAVELSALRTGELGPLTNALASLDLRRYRHIAFHAPSRYGAEDEAFIVETLRAVADRGWWIVVHPDAVIDVRLWKPIEPNLCFENMDRRKPIGRTARELSKVFDEFPSAGLCFDIGHAHQVDRTMTEARQILRQFGRRVKQIHVSEVNTASEHVGVSLALRMAIEKVVDLVEDRSPLIIESIVPRDRFADELVAVSRAFEHTVHALTVPD
jgi:hypothetical protein